MRLKKLPDVLFYLRIEKHLQQCCDLVTYKMSESYFVILGKDLFRLRPNKESFCPGKLLPKL